MLPFKQFRGNLAEDLDFLGLSTQATNALAESRISEETYAPISESTELSYSEGESPYVSESTLEQIGALVDTDSLTAEEANSIIEGLMSKAPEADCGDLFDAVFESLQAIAEGNEIAESNFEAGDIESALLTILESIENNDITGLEAIRVLNAIIDAPLDEDLGGLRDEVVEELSQLTELRKILKKVGGSIKRVTVKRMSSSDRAKARQRYRKNRAKIKRQRIKRGKKAVVKRAKELMDRARKKFKRESNELAQRLRNRALAESTAFADDTHIVERIGRVFYELTYHVNEDVIAVMEDQFDILCTSLCESQEELELAVRPCVAIIAECMRDIEQGNC